MNGDANTAKIDLLIGVVKRINEDFKNFEKTIENKIDQKIDNRFKLLEKSILLKLGSVIVVSVGVSFVAFAYINDYRLDFTNEQYNARFERIESIKHQPSGNQQTTPGIPGTMIHRKGR